MQRFGVGLLGDSGPDAAIVLGTKSFNLSKVLIHINMKYIFSLYYLTLLGQLDHIVETLNDVPEHL